ncbi:phosphate transporter 4;3 [Actinidia rufa]|uniref:Phosphate transporter 43 n=1 Tax=Actinidia rufa TaxID=165716 RepID=A0A7J0FSI9_9ERIC|nr:phosphate transporter 4;3 [Actinidia rufa]
MNLALSLAHHRSVHYRSLPTFQNPKPLFKPQPPNPTPSPPKLFNRSSSSSRNALSHGAGEIRPRVLVRVGGSASSSVPDPGEGEGEGEALREQSFVEFITSERVKVVAMLALALALCNADRVVMSVAIVPLSIANGWRQSFAGVVQSSFLWGYLISPIAGGTLADYYGGKVVMAWGVALWSLATFLTPWAAETSLWALLAMRVLLGIAEGVALPCMNNMIARWFPQTERSRAVGLAMAGFQLGSALGLTLSPILMSQGGIFGPFVIFGLSGFLWVLVWLSATSSTPDRSSQISRYELEYIQSKRQKSSGIENKLKTTKVIPPFRRLLSKLPTWSLIVANAMHSWGFFVILSWMPIYFKTIYHVDLRQAAWFSAVPWSMMAFVGYFAGVLSDMLIQSGRTVTLTRKIMQSIGFIGPGIALIGLTMAKRPTVASAWLTLAVGLKSFSHCGFLVNLQEIAPQYSGVLHGISNTAGTFAAIVGTVGAGFFVDIRCSVSDRETLTLESGTLDPSEGFGIERKREINGTNPPTTAKTHHRKTQKSAFSHITAAAKRVVGAFSLLLFWQRKSNSKEPKLDTDRVHGQVIASSSSIDNSTGSSSQTQSRFNDSDSYGPSKATSIQAGAVAFSIEEIFKATDNFSSANKIGEGGFGTVYKGKLKDGSLVAIKRARKDIYDKHMFTQFKNEILTLSKIEHLNLVRLFGYLEHGDERIIIVEYVANGTVREHLDGTRGNELEIAERLDIAIDVAHAVTYLHMYTDPPIIHRDVKASNILITEKLRAKVADFGLARITAEDPGVTHISTQVKGTAGYLDPEYLKTYQLTPKSDVYSFARRRPWRDCLPPPSHHPWPIGAPARPVEGHRAKRKPFEVKSTLIGVESSLVRSVSKQISHSHSPRRRLTVGSAFPTRSGRARFRRASEKEEPIRGSQGDSLPLCKIPATKVSTGHREALQRLKLGDAVVAMDPRLRRSPASIMVVEKVLKLARQCLAPQRQSRPSMKKCGEILWRIRKDFRDKNLSHAAFCFSLF